LAIEVSSTFMNVASDKAIVPRTSAVPVSGGAAVAGGEARAGAPARAPGSAASDIARA
jgi:hypothetical protein